MKKNILKDQFYDKGAGEGHGEYFRSSMWISEGFM